MIAGAPSNMKGSVAPGVHPADFPRSSVGCKSEDHWCKQTSCLLFSHPQVCCWVDRGRTIPKYSSTTHPAQSAADPLCPLSPDCIFPKIPFSE